MLAAREDSRPGPAKVAEAQLRRISPGVVGVLACVALCLTATQRSTSSRVAFLADDAFYYTVPARHFVAHGIPSLDGVNPGNGFHPLLFLVDVAATALHFGPVYLLNVAIGVACLFVAGLALRRFHLAHGDGRAADLALIVFLILPHTFASSLTGLESTLYAVALVIFYDALGRHLMAAPSWRSAASVAAAALFAYAARTEGLVQVGGAVVGLLGFSVVHPERRRHALLAAAGVLSGLLVGLAAFGAFGILTTGHATPSSVAQKSVLFQVSRGDLSVIAPARLLSGWALFGLAPIVVLLWPIVLRTRRLLRRGALSAAVLGGLTATLAVYLTLIPVFQWHYAPSFVVPALLLFAWIDDAPPRRVRLLAGGACALAILLANAVTPRWYALEPARISDTPLVLVYAFAALLPFRASLASGHLGRMAVASGIATMLLVVDAERSFRPPHLQRVGLATCLSASLPPGASVGTRAAGFYAHLLEQRVVNLDGAISWPALEAVRADSVVSFIHAQHIDVLVDMPPVPGYRPEGLHLQLRADAPPELLERWRAGRAGCRPGDG